MEARPHSAQYTREVTLPSGRRIEVRYFDAPESHSPDPDLHRCGGCGCEFVQPVDWNPMSHSYWSVTLRCPNCHWSGTGVFAQDVVDRFDQELDRGSDELAAGLERMASQNMAASLERFVAALHAGHILADDF